MYSVIKVGNQRVRPKNTLGQIAPLKSGEKVNGVDHKTDHHNNAHPFVDGQGCLVSPEGVAELFAQDVVKKRRLKPVADWIRNVNIRKRWNNRSTALKRLIRTFVISWVIVILFVITSLIACVTPFNILLFSILLVLTLCRQVPPPLISACSASCSPSPSSSLHHGVRRLFLVSSLSRLTL